MKASVYPAPDGWRWNIRGVNGEILAQGEAYVRRIDAENTVRELFSGAMPVEVAVRDHSGDVVDHYPVGPAPIEPVNGDQERY